LKGAAGAGEATAGAPAPASPTADASPFAAPPQGAPPDKTPPGKSVIDSPWRQIQPPEQARFGFGSYGRVGFDVTTGLDGASPVDIVDFRPILGKDPYQELHFFYKDRLYDLGVLVKSTLAFNEKLFHYDGDFDAQMAVRELYAELSPTDDLALWVGARMYRGQNVYIFDFWPLDDQNTLGGGAAARFGEVHRVQAHIGVNRLVDDSFFTFQTIELPLDDRPGSRQAEFLDRNRGTASLTYSVDLPAGLHAKVHGEATYLPPGTRRTGVSATPEHLPADHGFLIGGQLGWRAEDGALRDTTADVFVRYARGLSAYDELQVPFGFDTDFSVTDAERLIVALGGAVETEWFGVLYGAFWQRFEDSDGVDDREDSDQYAVAARPLAYIGPYFRCGLEASWQGVRHRGIFPETGSEEFQHVTKLTLLAGIAPRPGVFSRPELNIFFGWKWLNAAAAHDLGRRRLAEEPDRDEQTFGVLAEWWF
jgi:maltoporin